VKNIVTRKEGKRACTTILCLFITKEKTTADLKNTQKIPHILHSSFAPNISSTVFLSFAAQNNNNNNLVQYV